MFKYPSTSDSSFVCSSPNHMHRAVSQGGTMFVCPHIALLVEPLHMHNHKHTDERVQIMQMVPCVTCLTINQMTKFVNTDTINIQLVQVYVNFSLNLPWQALCYRASSIHLNVCFSVTFLHVNLSKKRWSQDPGGLHIQSSHNKVAVARVTVWRSIIVFLYAEFFPLEIFK